MKIVVLCIFSFLFFVAVPDISTIRKTYSQAAYNEEVTTKLFQELQPISKSDHKTLVAYKGAVMTLKAKFETSEIEKKQYFKEGIVWIDYAVKMDPKNIEIRCIRLSIQEYTPRRLLYHGNIDEDKTYILENYSRTSNQEIKAFVKGYAIQSKSFERSEKKIFQN